MSRPEERHIEACGLSLAGRYWPGKGLPVLALHGWLDNANSFAPLAEYLDNPLFALDFPGHGHSQHRPPGTALHFVDYVRDVVAVLDALGWRQCLLLGHSMGAGVASLVAGTFPERLRGLALIEGLGPLSGEAGEAPGQLRKAVDAMLRPAGNKRCYPSREEAIVARTGGFGGLGRDAAALLCQRGLEEVPGGWQWRADSRLRLPSSLRLSEEQVRAFLRAIPAPVWLLCGQQGMGGNGGFDARVREVPEIEVIHQPGTHHLHMEKPAETAAALRGFIARIADGA